MILFAETEEVLLELISQLDTEGKKDGMRMNKEKTQIMCNEIAMKKPRKQIVIDGEKLEEVNAYKYIGLMLNCSK